MFKDLMREYIETLVPQDRSRYILGRTAKEKQQTYVRVVNRVHHWYVERKKMEKDVHAYLWLRT